MEGKILSELQQIKQLKPLAAKQALTVTDASLFTGLGKSHIYKPVCAKKIPYCKRQGGKLTCFDGNGLTAWQPKYSTAETRLQCKDSINFSSVYFESMKTGEMPTGYGEPPQTEELKRGRPNPFFESRTDGCLFILSPDISTVEILTVPQGRQLIRGYAAQLADEQLNGKKNGLRKTAKTETVLARVR